MQPAAYGILDPGIVVRIHGGERRACQRRPHAVLGMVPHTGTMMVETSVPSYPFVAETFSTPHYSPLVQPVAHRPLEPLVRGSNPRRGATPIPLRNTRSLFSFRSEGHTEPQGQILASMETRMACGVPSTVFPSYFPVAPEQPSRAKERRPPSTVRKGTPPAITPTGLATVCKTVHGWVRLPQSPLTGYGQNGADACRRPPAVSERTQIRHGRIRALRPIAPDGKRWSRSAGDAFRPILPR